MAVKSVNRIIDEISAFAGCIPQERGIVSDVFTSPQESTTHFTSLKSFLIYFSHFKELPITASKPLVIRDCHAKQLNVVQEISAHQTVETRETALYLLVLDTFMAVLGKSAVLSARNVGLLEYDYSLNNDFSLQLSIPMVLRAEKDDKIVVNLTDLLNGMQNSGNTTLQLQEGQKLSLIGVSPDEQISQQNIAQDVSAIFLSRLLRGANFSFQCSKISCAIGTHISPVLHRIIEIEGPSKLIIEERPFFEDLSEFNDRICSGALFVPPGEKLVIKHKALGLIYREYEDTKHLHNREWQVFMLDQILLSRGKEMDALPVGIQGEYDNQTNVLSLSHPEGFYLKEGTGSLMVNLSLLSELMLHDKNSHFKPNPNQPVIIYNIDKSTIASYLAKGEVADKLYPLLFKYCTAGFTWNAKLNGNFTTTAGMLFGRHCIKIVSDESIEFQIKPAAGHSLILSLVYHYCSENLYPALSEGDADALKFMVFKALVFYCTDRYNMGYIPPFFKTKTRLNLMHLLLNDEYFQNAKDEISANPALLKQYVGICKGDLEQFKALDVEQLPPPLRFFMTKILALTYEELQGGEFITQCMQVATQFLQKQESRTQPLSA